MQISKSQNSLSFESQIVDGLHYRLLDVVGQGLGLVESEYSVATFQYSLRSPLHEQDKFVFDLVNRHLILVGRVERNFTNLRQVSIKIFYIFKTRVVPSDGRVSCKLHYRGASPYI
jgi:hypothetical protein